MDTDLLQALHADPYDETTWLVLGDWLEEQGDPRAELLRLTLALRDDSFSPPRQAQEQRVRQLLAGGLVPCVPVLRNSIGLELVLVPPGRFRMGSPPDEGFHSPDEGPVHLVTITRPFYLGRYPVTQQQYERILGLTPSHFASTGPPPYRHVVDGDTSTFPVDSVPYEDAELFCERLSRLDDEQLAGRVYRLPTEAEWEYACRAGSTTPFYVGDSLSSTQANFDGGYPYGNAERNVYLKRTCPVGTFPPNAFGLYDMIGNVWEWCSDWFDEGYYARSPAIDPRSPPTGDGHVLRGGSWIDASWHCRSADRSHREALHYVGMRVAMDVR